MKRKGRKKKLGSAKTRELYIGLLMGDLTIKFTRHIRELPIFVMTRICPNDVAADPCSQPRFAFSKAMKRPLAAGAQHVRCLVGSNLQGCTKIKALASARQEKMGIDGPNHRTSHTIGRGDVWLVTSDVFGSNEKSICYISHKFKSAPETFVQERNEVVCC